MADMPTPAVSPAPVGSDLVDLLDRVVARGAVVSGDLVVCLAGIDLIRVDLRLLLVGVEAAMNARSRQSEGGVR